MADLNVTDREAVEAAIFAGRKIDAIKLYREAVRGTGLAEAKQAVEVMEARLRQVNPAGFSVSTGKTGCLGLIVVALALGSAGLTVVMLVVGK